MSKLTTSTCFLFDNGSLRAASTLALRRVAHRLGQMAELPVRPVSLLHSHRVEADELDGINAELLEPALEQFAANSGRRAIALPLFFGPSGALVDYLPPRLDRLRRQFPACEFILADCLESPVDDSGEVLVAELAHRIRATIRERGFSNPAVILTDHGSPLPAVTAVRNRLGQALAHRSDFASTDVSVASMERRDGEEYAFNEPLLETALRENARADHHEAVVALQFLFPGRHAGPGGDIATICESVRSEFPNLQVAVTDPIGESEAVLALLLRRLDAVR